MGGFLREKWPKMSQMREIHHKMAQNARNPRNAPKMAINTLKLWNFGCNCLIAKVFHVRQCEIAQEKARNTKKQQGRAFLNYPKPCATGLDFIQDLLHYFAHVLLGRGGNRGTRPCVGSDNTGGEIERDMLIFKGG